MPDENDDAAGPCEGPAAQENTPTKSDTAPAVRLPDMVHAALVYATHGGWPVFPANPRTKRPLIKTGRDHAEFATRDPRKIRAWFGGQYHDAAIAAPTGAASGIVVIDADRKHDGERLLVQAEAKYGALSRAFRVRTQSGGLHIYLAHPGRGIRIKSVAGTLIGPGVDVRGDGGIVVLPPSPGYRWEAHRDGPFPPLPAGWLAKLRATGPQAKPLFVPPPRYTGVVDERSLEALRALRSRYRADTARRDDADLLDRLLRRQALAPIGKRDATVTRCGFLVGLALPDAGPDAALAIAAPSLLVMPMTNDGEGYHHWCAKFARSYERGSESRRVRDEADRLLWAEMAEDKP